MNKQFTSFNPALIVAANQDILIRIEQRGIDLLYDEVLDTLFIEIGGPMNAVNVHVNEDVMLRIDPKTLEVVAGEIPVYMADPTARHKKLTARIDELGVRSGRDPLTRLPPTQAMRVGKLLQEWIEEFARS